MTTSNNDEPLDLIWGAAAIAKAIGRRERTVFHMLSNGVLPAKQIGGRWVVSRRKLLEALVGGADALGLDH
jgi:hypothetical protein